MRRSLRRREIADLEAAAETVKNRGSCLPDKYDLRLKEGSAAEARYRKALAKDPDLREAYNNLANLLFMGGRVEEARTWLAQAEAHHAPVHPELKKAVLGRSRT